MEGRTSSQHTATISPFLLPIRLDDLDKGEKLSVLAITIVVVLVLQFIVKLYQARMKFRRLQSRGIVRSLSH